MGTNKLWEFPVPSTCIAEGGVKLIYPGGDALLLFDYYDEEKNDAVFNSGIVFDAVQAHRHTTEKFIKSLLGAYDTLVEITDSEWVKELREINKEIADYWNIKHYAIFLDSNGLFEFIARDYKILETKEGGINGLFEVK
ncbi:hypothetical protein [Candidatus Formimonas warabiya]|uniref:Uncharacterized protein n=1 Tax=Formimonas warabiya TaxID=1761012 RepID=A0A3G1KSD0_FORW1|nr:hypothetical protein [Candidatus Formimonas warabiya]ATW25304.1 hypothetical protein DCMF_11465 [Candidatus Formimonas warabiya]